MSKSTKKMITMSIISFILFTIAGRLIDTVEDLIRYRVTGMVIYKTYDVENDKFYLVLSDNVKHQVWPKDFMTHNIGEVFDKTYRKPTLFGFCLFVISAIFFVGGVLAIGSSVYIFLDTNHEKFT